MRGTGSCDFQVSDLFVPEERSPAAFAAKPLQPGPLYSTPMITVFAATLPCVSIGIARAAIDAFIALPEGKTPICSANRLRDKPTAQADLGHAEAQLRSARAFLVEAVEEIWNEAAAGRTPTSARHRPACRSKSRRGLGASRRSFVQRGWGYRFVREQSAGALLSRRPCDDTAYRHASEQFRTWRPRAPRSRPRDAAVLRTR